MSNLAMSFGEPQQAFTFPCALTEKYRPKLLGDFVGLERQRTILTNYAKAPFPTAFLFTGASGTGRRRWHWLWRMRFLQSCITFPAKRPT